MNIFVVVEGFRIIKRYFLFLGSCFCNFGFLVDEKTNSEFELAPLKILTNFENPSSNPPLQRPKSGDFTLKMLIGSRL
jgi:hypothetical protein